MPWRKPTGSFAHGSADRDPSRVRGAVRVGSHGREGDVHRTRPRVRLRRRPGARRGGGVDGRRPRDVRRRSQPPVRARTHAVGGVAWPFRRDRRVRAGGEGRDAAAVAGCDVRAGAGGAGPAGGRQGVDLRRNRPGCRGSRRSGHRRRVRSAMGPMDKSDPNWYRGYNRFMLAMLRPVGAGVHDASRLEGPTPSLVEQYRANLGRHLDVGPGTATSSRRPRRPPARRSRCSTPIRTCSGGAPAAWRRCTRRRSRRA